MAPGLPTPNAFTAPLSGSAMPPPPPSSTPGAPKVAYERAFRAWSTPNVADVALDGGGGGALTYHVYTPADLAAPRSPSPSRAPEDASREKTSMATRVALVALGLVMVLGTAAVVLVASADEAPTARPTAARTASESALDLASRAAGPAPTDELAPPPPAPSGGVAIEPEGDVVAKPVVAAADKAPRKAPASGASPRASSSSPRAAPPAALRSAAPPPNPYGGTPASVLRPPPGYRP